MLRLVPELPTTPSGKIRKNELRELCWRRRRDRSRVRRRRRAPPRHRAHAHLARPEERNPLDHTTVARLRALVEDADPDPAIRVVIITGAGPAFSAGGDLRAYLDLYRNRQAFRAFLDEFRALNARPGARSLREHRDGERRVRGRRARARAGVRPDHHRRRRPDRRRAHPHRPDRRRRRQPAPGAGARCAAGQAAAPHRAPVVGRDRPSPRGWRRSAFPATSCGRAPSSSPRSWRRTARSR